MMTLANDRPIPPANLRNRSHEVAYLIRPVLFPWHGHNPMSMQQNEASLYKRARDYFDAAVHPKSTGAAKADWLKRAVADQKAAAKLSARLRQHLPFVGEQP